MRCTVWDAINIGPGTLADYHALAGFHYRGGSPGGVMRVIAAKAESGKTKAETVGVLVECLPALGCMLRDVATGGRFRLRDRTLAAALLNKEVRCIARVVVHPQYRGLGLAVALVREALRTAEVPYVEALAAMGRVHPFFAQAGMTAYDRPADAKTVRLIAALEAAGHRAMDLCDATRLTRTAWLERELRRFAGKEGEWAELVAFARRRVLSQPVYFLSARDSG